MNAGGRPQKEFAEDQIAQIQKLSEIGCSDAEMFGVMGVSKSTWIRMKARDPRIVEAIDNGRGKLAVRLRRMQIEMATSGSVPMLIHLGKCLLAQGTAAPQQESTENNPLTQFLPRAETIRNLPKSTDEE
jgi:hypothetical protein